MKRLSAYLLIFILAISCRDKIDPIPTPEPDDTDQPTDSTGSTGGTEKPLWPEGKGKSYIWDDDVIPEITLNISVEEWNTLLEGYDKNSNTTQFVKTDFVFNKADVCDTLTDIGLRLRDNIRCKRPEGKTGEGHKRNEASWNQCNYELSFTTYNSKKTLREVKSIFLKSCYNDPTYAREMYCYDLFRRYGFQDMSRNIYCRLNIHVEGDENAAYIGLYQMIEPVDAEYIKERVRSFGGDKGFLWKCRTGATLQNSGINIGLMDNNGNDPAYALVTNQQALSTAKVQLNDFILNLNRLQDAELYEWLENVIDIESLLRSYAVLTVIGANDDYWNAGNNYYLYFSSQSSDRYKVFFIPHNFDITLGSTDGSIMQDSALQSPFDWGRPKNPLIKRLLLNEYYLEMYKGCLAELITPEFNLFNQNIGMAIIQDLMYQASHHTQNDTGYNLKATDRCAAWSTKQYRLTTDDEFNYFKVRTETIAAALNQ